MKLKIGPFLKVTTVSFPSYLIKQSWILLRNFQLKLILNQITFYPKFFNRQNWKLSDNLLSFLWRFQFNWIIEVKTKSIKFRICFKISSFLSTHNKYLLRRQKSPVFETKDFWNKLCLARHQFWSSLFLLWEEKKRYLTFRKLLKIFYIAKDFETKYVNSHHLWGLGKNIMILFLQFIFSSIFNCKCKDP